MLVRQVLDLDSRLLSLEMDMCSDLSKGSVVQGLSVDAAAAASADHVPWILLQRAAAVLRYMAVLNAGWHIHTAWSSMQPRLVMACANCMYTFQTLK